MVLNSGYTLRVIIVTVICTFLYFQNCTKNIAGSEVTNEESVKLVGKVLDQKGSGIPNIVAKVGKLNLTDTTDDGGNYSFVVSPGALQSASIKLDTLKDSVKIYNSGNIVSNIQITDWIDTLPNVYLVQRNIYGQLETTDTVFKAITAVITIFDNNKVQIGSIEKNLWFNNGTFGFSGFTYFDNDASKQYSVYVKVFNKDSIYTGKSKTIYFDKSAGDIEIPSFDPFFNPSLQVTAGNDTVLSVNDTLKLSASIVEGTISENIKWEWNLNGTGFIKTSNQDTTVVLPDFEITKQYIVKAIDISGNIAIDTIEVLCVNDTPRISYSVPGIPCNSVITIQAMAFDFGRITKWEWNIGGITYAQIDSNNVSYITFRSPSLIQNIKCILKVTDEDETTKCDTSILNVGQWIEDKRLSLPAIPSQPIASYNNQLYTVYQSYENNNYLIGLKQFNGESWENYGNGYNQKSRGVTMTNLDLKISNTGEIYSMYTENDSLHILKYINDSLTNIGTFPFDVTYKNEFRSCITNDGTLFIMKIINNETYTVTFYQYKNGTWTITNPLSNENGYFSEPFIGAVDSIIYFGGRFSYNIRIFKFDGENVTTIIDDNSLNYTRVVYKIFNSEIYICGNYWDDSGSKLTFIKKYADGTLQNIDPAINFLDDITTLFVFNNELYFSVIKNEHTMYSIYKSYIYKYTGNAITQVGGMIESSESLANNIKSFFNYNNNIYAIIASGSIRKLQ